MLEFVRDAEIEIAVNALQELRIDKVLLLTEPFLFIIRRVVAQSPEIIRIIAIGRLETGDMVFPGKKYRGIQHQDQLLPKRIKSQYIDIGRPDRTVLAIAGFEETSGDAAKAPIGFQGTHRKRKGQQILCG